MKFVARMKTEINLMDVLATTLRKLWRDSLRASHASYIFAPSPGSFPGAYIQFPQALISAILEILAQTKLVMDSATAILAIAAESINPLMGCSPHATAVPVIPK